MAEKSTFKDENLREKVKLLVQQLETNTVDSPHLFGWLHLRIKDLSLDECKAIVKGLKVNVNNVKWLDISPINISWDGLVCIIDSLKTNTYVTKLNLHGMPDNDLYDEEDDDTYFIPMPAQSLMEVFQVNKTLVELIITNTLAIDDDIQTLVTGLQTNRTLTRFTLECNPNLTVKSAYYLSQLVKSTETLEEISLCGPNHANDQWATPIADAMKNNQSIKTLNMIDGEISDLGAQAIGDMLAVNQVLQCLRLGSNQITDEGAKVLADTIKCNSTLNTLSIDGNRFTKLSPGGQALFEAKQDTLPYIFLS